ncbi:MAG: nucleotidyltransferase domain-containing protein [Bryobacterales bacterium]|nr:nucleotidyltransferase domain-containing protein [Bryobacterales bacterium]
MGSAGTRPVTGAVVKRVVRAIVGAIDPEQIILFGSRARGAHGMDSDIDLLVVQSEPFDAARSRYRESVRAYEAVSGMGVATDILVYSRPEVEYWRDSLNHVVARALREGEVLYERPEMRSDARSVRGT